MKITLYVCIPIEKYVLGSRLRRRRERDNYLHAHNAYLNHSPHYIAHRLGHTGNRVGGDMNGVARKGSRVE